MHTGEGVLSDGSKLPYHLHLGGANETRDLISLQSPRVRLMAKTYIYRGLQYNTGGTTNSFDPLEHGYNGTQKRPTA